MRPRASHCGGALQIGSNGKSDRQPLDARAAVAFIRERLPRERIGAIGSSLGGAAALLGPAPLPVDALVLESVYPDIGSAIANRVRVVLGSTLGEIAAPAIAWLLRSSCRRLSRQRIGVLDRMAESTAVTSKVSLPLLHRYTSFCRKS